MRQLTHSFHVRLLAILVVSLGAALATVAVMIRWSTTVEFDRYVQQNRDEMQHVAQTVAADTGSRLVVANPDGRVFIDSSRELLGQTLDPPPVGDATTSPVPRVLVLPKGSAPLPAAADASVAQDPGADDAPNWLYAKPTVASLAGIAPATATLFDPEQLFLASVGHSLVVGVLVGGVVALGLALMFSRRVVRPVEALTAAARRMAQGDLDQRVAIQGDDEIGQLAVAFNAMAEGLTRTEQLRRTMVADVAHELRTPLTNLRGYLEALRDGVATPDAEVLGSLHDEAVFLSQLVDDLQDLALSDAGQLTLRRELVDANELLAGAVRAVEPQARHQAVTLALRGIAGRVDVWADARRVRQILRNLLSNALAYTPAGGNVTVVAAAEAGRLAVQVRDTGVGIPPEHVGNIFERFYRVDGSRARTTGGAGIGLAVVKQLVDAHGGAVSVESVVGQGTTFSFTLPLA
jgi:signal transduction histidine kinase